jgi:inhibitor of KinA
VKEIRYELEQVFNIFPLGDSAITFDLGNSFSIESNLRVRNMQIWLKQDLKEMVKDVICGYNSVTLIYDSILVKRKFSSAGTAFEIMRKKLILAWEGTGDWNLNQQMELVRVPVCYDKEFGQDLEFVAKTKNLSEPEIIRIHYERIYYIYLIGFLPGFSYMAEVDDSLIMPRKMNPVMVAPGSVGISGKQTGIYPLQCPGGWQILGRTPLKLFDQHLSDPVKLRAGQQVQFYPISRDEFDYEWFRENGSAE